MGFPRQEHWSVLPFPSGDLPDAGIEPASPALVGASITAEPPGMTPAECSGSGHEASGVVSGSSSDTGLCLPFRQVSAALTLVELKCKQPQFWPLSTLLSWFLFSKLHWLLKHKHPT